MAPDNTDLVAELARLGVIQFGNFAIPEKPGAFAPIAINIGLLTSYPGSLAKLALEIGSLVQIDSLTHILAMPAAIPLGAAVGLQTNLPLMYPAFADPESVEGAYDYDVPTVLLTVTLTDGFAERAMIKRTKKLGLDVKAIVAVFDFGDNVDRVGIRCLRWRRVSDLLAEIEPLTPTMRTTIERWLAG